MNTIKEMKRDQTFDYMKGILILLVILGHSIQYQFGSKDCWYNHTFNFIYSFHMPLFIMISGYFFHSCLNRSFIENVRKKAKRLLLPWIVVSFITILIYFISQWCLPNNQLVSSSIALQAYRILLSLWFLPCVFVLTMFYYLVGFVKMGGGKRLMGVFCIILFLVAFIKLAFFEYSQNLLFSFLTHCQILRHTLSFGIGIIIYRYYHKFNLCYIAFPILGLVLIRYFYGIWISEYSFLYKILDGICCGLVAYCILNHICKILPKKKSNILSYCGRNSLGIYCAQHIFVRLLDWNDLFTRDTSILGVIGVFVLLSVLSICFIEITKRLLKEKSFILGI